MPKVLITDYVHDDMIKGLESRGYHVDIAMKINMDELSEVIHEYEGVVINSKIRMHQEMIDKGARLRFIGRLGSGLEIIDVPYAEKKGIHVLNTPTGNNNAVAEHAMGMLLALSNNLLRSDREVRQQIWQREQNRGWELKGKTIGIIGFGHTGSQFARKMSSWELNLITYDKYKQNLGNNFPFVTQVSLEDILSQSDVVSLHLPLTEETLHMVDEDFLSACKDNVVIVNTSRGKVIDTSSLVKALESGKVGGACLDVFENEKPHTYSLSETNTYTRLYNMENVVLSPHVAGWTHESLRKIARVLLEKIDLANIVF